MIRPLLLAALLPLLPGCSLSSVIGTHSIDYNHSLEVATDTLLVLNILRARDNAPLHFSTIGAIHGAFSLSAGIGYDLTAVNNGVQPAGLVASNPSFDIGPLDRQEFARGLLRPIDPALFRLLSDRGLPDPLLLHLLVSRFDEGPGGRAIPNTPGNPDFAAAVEALTRHGRLQFNGYTRLIPLGPRLTGPQAAAPEVLAELREPGISIRQDGPGWRLYRAVGQLALCVAEGGGRYRALAMDTEPPQISPMNQEGSPCTAEEVADHPIAAGRAASPGLSWWLRSVDEVLHFLGAVQRREEAGEPVRIRIGEATPRFFRLWPAPPPRPRLSVDYRGGRWWVAEQDRREDMTLSVLALTAQLLNLQKSAGEIPATGTLRLVR
ncbi:hypothetical protein [Paracraurococcus lichenis]|uniref:Uncharacterized protein n=1 Tax=Paracraurococcus lichenis TaxID=3064888 RepID=A0ABT9E3S1_9PROT|nr:hypothetical protein [Paracraurococcus sp. LOR1-02]MDO9710798.1 hypothetical protein [Paracraurococcus sp. LOR1-02]